MAYAAPGVMPGGLSADSYLDRHLRSLDAEHYSAAGLLPYRKGSSGSLELLFALERPWNSFTQSYDPIGWNIFGGKRIPRQEKASEATAVRCFTDAVGQASGAPATDVMYRLMANSFAVWYALGKFVLLMVEVTDNDLDVDFPEKFLEWKKGQGSEDFTISPEGFKKWTKQIDAVEWVTASDLVTSYYNGEKIKDVSDLLSNILQINGFREFLEGSLDPMTAFAESGTGETGKGASRDRSEGKGGGGGGGKGKNGKGKSGGGKGKGDSKGKGWKGSGKGGKMGMPAYGAKGAFPMGGPMGGPMPPMGGPMVYPSYDQNGMEMQRQMYGEQLYLMVQPMSPSPYLAQKITGMLLELPQNELMMNLTNHEELRKRVMEALEVLKEDGIV